MKQYVIDEFRPEDFGKVKDYLDKHCKVASIEGVYWMMVPDGLLTEQQLSHEQCKPFFLGLELENDRLACGLLVRSASNIRCHCIAYANKEQRNWIIETLDSVMEKIGIIT